VSVFEWSWWIGKKQTDKKKLNKRIVGGLRETIRIHGPITKLLIGSAAKRIAGHIKPKEKKDESICGDS
jgi:hypothetical protein